MLVLVVLCACMGACEAWVLHGAKSFFLRFLAVSFNPIGPNFQIGLKIAAK